MYRFFRQPKRHGEKIYVIILLCLCDDACVIFNICLIAAYYLESTGDTKHQLFRFRKKIKYRPRCNKNILTLYDLRTWKTNAENANKS